MNYNWENFMELVLLFLGTYGERFFIAIHALICCMEPEVFSFLCLSFIFIFVIFIKPEH